MAAVGGRIIRKAEYDVKMKLFGHQLARLEWGTLSKSNVIKFIIVAQATACGANIRAFGPKSVVYFPGSYSKLN